MRNHWLDLKDPYIEGLTVVVYTITPDGDWTAALRPARESDVRKPTPEVEMTRFEDD